MLRSLALSAVVACLPIAAQACEFGYCWGGLGFGPDGVTGYSVRLNTAPDAEIAARAACGHKCTKVEVFHDSCASLAVGPDGSGFLGMAPEEVDASQEAHEKCSEIHGYCVVRVSACSK
jgi:hypothetical protein